MATARRVDVIGIDAPLGWPAAFVTAVEAHTNGRGWPGAEDRSALTHRDTDREVRRLTRRLPLSVSADKLGVTAMRCALLQRRWGSEVWGKPATRDGSGPLVETYPAATLRAWDMDPTGYKGGTGAKAAAGRAARERIVSRIAGECGAWLNVSSVTERCIASDHVLDALVSALAAMAAFWGLTQRPPDEAAANVEGWIHIPIEPLTALGATARSTARP